MRPVKKERSGLGPAVVKGLTLGGFFLAFFAFLMSKMDCSVSLIAMMSNLVLAVISFFIPYHWARRKRHHGLAIGLLTSGALYLILLLTGLILLRQPLTGRAWLKLFLMLSAGALGGVSGVNAKVKFR